MLTPSDAQWDWATESSCPALTSMRQKNIRIKENFQRPCFHYKSRTNFLCTSVSISTDCWLIQPASAQLTTTDCRALGLLFTVPNNVSLS